MTHVSKIQAQQVCMKCGNLGHDKNKCTSAPRCFNCQSGSHYIKDCRKPIYCHLCERYGHTENFCWGRRVD